MTKDRLEELHAAQRFVNNNKDEETKVVIFTGSKQEFLNEAHDIRDMISKIQTNVENVKLKYSAVLTATQPDEKTKHELEDLTAEIKKTAVKVRDKLILINIDVKQKKNTNLSQADLRIIKTQHSTLTRTFNEVMNEYNSAQIDYRDRTKSMIQRQLEITGHTISDDELENMLEQGNLAVFAQGILIDSQQARQSLADIEERYGDIIKLEKSINELHGLFVDMAILVESQSEQIDRIEHHVTQAKDAVVQGGQDLKISEKLYKKYFKKKMCLIICPLSVLLLIIIILVCKLTLPLLPR